MQDHHWYAVRVKPNFEYSVDESLRAKGYRHLLPTYTCVRKSAAGRRRSVRLPLFPGYILCHFDPSDRLPILTIPGVMNVLSFNGVPIPIDESEIDSVRRCVASLCHAEPWPFVGAEKRVTVAQGPLAGVEGVLVSADGSDRLVVSVSMLGRSMAIRLKRNWIDGLPLSEQAIRISA